MPDCPGNYQLFSPNQVSGLAIWIKADSLNLTNGQAVSTWADQSGNGNDATQGTGSLQPIYTTNVINGLPAVLFDGTDDFMHFAAIPITTAATVLVVVQPTLNTSSQKNYANIFNSRQQSVGTFMCAKIATNFWGTFTGGDISSGSALKSGYNYLLETVTSSGSVFLFQRGAQCVTSAASEVGTGTTATIGKDETNANREYAGYIAEVIVYNVVLAAADRKNVETFLLQKYSI